MKSWLTIWSESANSKNKKEQSLYNVADILGKQALLKGIFLGGFMTENEGGRTALLNPMFAENSLKITNLLKADKTGNPEKYLRVSVLYT